MSVFCPLQTFPKVELSIGSVPEPISERSGPDSSGAETNPQLLQFCLWNSGAGSSGQPLSDIWHWFPMSSSLLMSGFPVHTSFFLHSRQIKLVNSMLNSSGHILMLLSERTHHTKYWPHYNPAFCDRRLWFATSLAI